MRLFAQGKAIKGILIPEWASTEDPAQPDRKAQWISDARALVKKPGWKGFRGGPVLQQDLQVPELPLVRRLQPGLPGRVRGDGQRRLLHAGRSLSKGHPAWR